MWLSFVCSVTSAIVVNHVVNTISGLLCEVRLQTMEHETTCSSGSGQAYQPRTVALLRVALASRNHGSQRGGLPAFYRNSPEFFARIVVFDSSMADREQKMLPNYDQKQADGSENVKIICLGDSAVGKSK